MRTLTARERAPRLVGAALLALSLFGSATLAVAHPQPAFADDLVTDPRHGDDEDCDTVAGRQGELCEHGIAKRFLQSRAAQEVLGASTTDQVSVEPLPIVRPRGIAEVHSGDEEDCDTVAGKDGPLCDGKVSSQ